MLETFYWAVVWSSMASPMYCMMAWIPWIRRTGFALQHCFQGDSWVRDAAMARPWCPTGKPLSWEPRTKVWVCKAQLLVINFAQSSKGKMNWITSEASVYQEERCDRSISWHISLPIYSLNLIITNRVWLKHQVHTFRSLVCNLQLATEKLELSCF